MTGKEETVSDGLNGTSSTALLTQPAPLSPIEPGQIIDGRITIRSLIGRGAMGEVYKAEQRGVDRPVAIKTLNMTRASDKEGVTRFFREARMLSTLDHPNIVKIYALGQTDDGQPYLVLDYVEGPTLAEALERGQVSSLDQFASIFEQLLDALAHAHSRGVIHRDIKPRNIVLEPQDDGWRVHLLDFGIGRQNEQGDEQRLTRTGAIIGSPTYMSPEQCMGKTPDARSDLYSLSCVMYEALTGRPPFQAENAAELMRAHVTDQASTLTSSNTKFRVPPGLLVMVELGLQKDPVARYQSAAAMLDDLRLITAGSAPSCRKSRKRKKISAAASPLLSILSGVSLAIISLLALQSYLNLSKQQEHNRYAKVARANHLMQNAMSYRLIRRWDKVEKDLNKAQSIYESLGGCEQELVDVYATRAGLVRKKDDFAAADTYYAKAISLVSSEHVNWQERLADLEHDRAMNLIDQGRIAEAHQLLKQADQDYFSHLPAGTDDAAHARLINLRGLLCCAVRIREYHEAAARFPELIQLQEVYGADGGTVAGTMHEYAQVLRVLGNKPAADAEDAVADEYAKTHDA